jgi:pantoate--beta-alanine ligase
VIKTRPIDGSMHFQIDRFEAFAHAPAMQVVRTVSAMQRLGISWRQKNLRVGFVPTMGYLHEGHLSLLRRARKLAGPRGKVVLSIYVNPKQFGPREDFSKYPRDLKRDLHLCKSLGTDVVFVPSDKEMYPQTPGQEFSTWVMEENLSRGMEGASRPTHFRGVTTVVAKLFNIVQPTVAVFGAKDYQQAAIMKRMVRDLNFPLKIDVAPIWREPDGLAMSSRNRLIKPAVRRQAVVLWDALEKVHSILRSSKKAVSAARLKSAVQAVINTRPAARLDYVEFFDPVTLVPVARVSTGTHMAIAVLIDRIRLIDNSRL